MCELAYLLLMCMAMPLVTCGVDGPGPDGPSGNGTVPCPRSCNFPKTKSECQQCLLEGYTEVARGKAGTFTGHRGLWNRLQMGAHYEWDEDRCWIHIKGINDKDMCHDIGPYIFGQNRCSGFEKASFKVMTNRCWAKFKKP